MTRSSFQVLALLAGLTLIWGTNWPLFRIALAELPVLTFRSLVLTASIIVLYFVMRLRGESFAVPRGKWPMLLLASLMNLTIWSVATSMAVLYIPSGYANGFMSLTEDLKLMFFSTTSLAESQGDDFRFDARHWDIWTVVER